MVFKISLKLKDDACPHLYLHTLREMMKNDTYLHPLMRNTLLLLKKTHMPYIRLATNKEIVFLPEKFMHFERALEPAITGWTRIEWSNEEKESYKKSPDKFYSEMLELYKKLGYLLSDREVMSEIEAAEMVKLTEPKEEKK